MPQPRADQLIIYAIRQVDFNQIYIVEKGNHQADYTIANPNLSWGTATGPTSGSGRVEYPACWTFLKTFGGWNDAFCGSAELSDGHVGAFFNAWAGTLTYADLLLEVKSLPNCVYRLTADFATTQNYSRTTTKTALYGNAGEGNIARSYNITGTGDNSFNRYECYVLVAGNKMTIGARSDGTWFKVADFQLEYICQEGEASEEIRGYLDNGRALQHQCWRMNDEWLDLSAFPECRNLQVDQIPANAIIKIAPDATVDASYNSSNIVKDGKCALLVITDEEPLTVAETFEAEKITYIRHDSPDEWHQLFLPFTVGASNNQKIGRLVRKDGNKLFCQSANGSRTNVPALVRFSDANITLQHVNVSPTVEYVDEEWGIHGTYRLGNEVTPLRWNINGIEKWDDINIIFLGDVNRDGLITITDVIVLVNIVLGMDMTPPYQYDHDAADMNGDGDLTITDITILINYIISGS